MLPRDHRSRKPLSCPRGREPLANLRFRPLQDALASSVTDLGHNAIGCSIGSGGGYIAAFLRRPMAHDCGADPSYREIPAGLV
jgi:hypothetical protein